MESTCPRRRTSRRQGEHGTGTRRLGNGNGKRIKQGGTRRGARNRRGTRLQGGGMV